MAAEPVVNIAYAEDHTMVRKSIVAYLNNMGGLQVVIEVSNGLELIEALEKAKVLPDICLIDVNMPGMDGFDTVVELRKRWKNIKVLALTVFDVDTYIVRMIMYGANGYILKKCDPEELKSAILSIYNNSIYYSDIATHQFVQDVKNGFFKLPELSAREVQVLKYCCGDMNYVQMAESMGTTTRSVEGYRDSLFKKLKVHNRVSLAMVALDLGYVLREIPTYINLLTAKTKKTK